MCLPLFPKCSFDTVVLPNHVYFPKKKISQIPLACTAQPRLKPWWSKRVLIQSLRRARTSWRCWNVRTRMPTWKQNSWATCLPSQLSGIYCKCDDSQRLSVNFQWVSKPLTNVEPCIIYLYLMILMSFFPQQIPSTQGHGFFQLLSSWIYIR